MGKHFVRSSHIIGYVTLLEAVKSDLRELVGSNVRLDNLFDAVKGTREDPTGVNNPLSIQRVSIEQFTAQNERIQSEQRTLSKRKSELESVIESQKDTEERFRAFKKQIALFAQLDIDDEQVLKQLLHHVFEKVEVHQGGSIKIHYNIAQPQRMGELLQGA